MVRKLFVGGNWKCNGSKNVIKDLVDGLNEESKSIPDDVTVIVSPPSLYLDYVKSNIDKAYNVSSQNCSASGNGAFTGELSCKMIKDFGINYTIIGHSERRKYYGDTNKIIGEKVKIALDEGLKVIACFGELLEERKANKTMDVIKTQLSGFCDVIGDNWDNVVFAYEPVWAIGTGVTASKEQAQEVHKEIRAWVCDKYGKKIADNLIILYGGSVKPKNCVELGSQPDVDGFLVGGASLKPKMFSEICNAYENKKKSNL